MTGLTVPKWVEGMQAGDADAYRAFVWLARKRAGDQPEGRYSDFDFPLLGVLSTFETDEDEEPEPDPTKAAASKPKSRRTAR
jgi:hypothetical protein